MASGLTGFDVAAMVVIVAGLVVIASKRVPKAYGLGLLCLAVFAVDTLAQIAKQPSIAQSLAFRVDDVRHGDKLWSPLTSMFVHAGFLHVFGNIFILVTAGPPLEDRIGGRKFLLIYFVAGVAALVAHTILALATTIVPADAFALGASGCIFGVLTTFAVRYPKEKLPLVLLFLVVWAPAFLVLLFYLGLNVYQMLTGGGQVAWWGHFAGFLVGLPFAYTLPAAAPTAFPKQGTTRGLPDAEKLAPLATTRELKSVLDRIRQFTPDERTLHDDTFADAWVDKFFASATCAEGHAFRRDGLTATCAGGETRVDFARA